MKQKPGKQRTLMARRFSNFPSEGDTNNLLRVCERRFCYSGQIERKLNDGSSEIKFPDGVVRKIRPDGTEEIVYLDGSVVTVQPNGDRVLLLPNGQKEIHTKEHKVE